jgi:DNA-directed RNA polymerase subunit RPC12/RpoP
MKIVIDIPEKTNAHIRSDYGHGIKGFRNADREILFDAIYHGTPYKDRPRGEWEWITEDRYKCTNCNEIITVKEVMNEPQYITCPMCDAKMGEGEANE